MGQPSLRERRFHFIFLRNGFYSSSRSYFRTDIASVAVFDGKTVKKSFSAKCKNAFYCGGCKTIPKFSSSLQKALISKNRSNLESLLTFSKVHLFG